MKTKEKKAFARRFSSDDWGWLCTKIEFLDAVDGGTPEQAEACAWSLIQLRDSQPKTSI